jgi:two-component system, chemotaxis family, chemotaxis protein CheY
MTILNVDDSATMRKIVTMSLSGAGHSVLEAENGAAALEKMKGAKIDLIILDVNMPVMNGLEFLKILRSDGGTKSVPVIMLTTQGEEDMRKTALGLGANDFLTKPFQKDQLLATVKKVAGA